MAVVSKITKIDGTPAKYIHLYKGEPQLLLPMALFRWFPDRPKTCIDNCERVMVSDCVSVEEYSVLYHMDITQQDFDTKKEGCPGLLENLAKQGKSATIPFAIYVSRFSSMAQTLEVSPRAVEAMRSELVVDLAEWALSTINGGGEWGVRTGSYANLFRRMAGYASRDEFDNRSKDFSGSVIDKLMSDEEQMAESAKSLLQSVERRQPGTWIRLGRKGFNFVCNEPDEQKARTLIHFFYK